MTLREKFSTYINKNLRLKEVEDQLLILRNERSDVSGAEITIRVAEDILILKRSIISHEELSDKILEESEQLESEIKDDLSLIGASKVRVPFGSANYILELKNKNVTGVFGEDVIETELSITKA